MRQPTTRFATGSSTRIMAPYPIINSSMIQSRLHCARVAIGALATVLVSSLVAFGQMPSAGHAIIDRPAAILPIHELIQHQPPTFTDAANELPDAIIDNSFWDFAHRRLKLAAPAGAVLVSDRGSRVFLVSRDPKQVKVQEVTGPKQFVIAGANRALIVDPYVVLSCPKPKDGQIALVSLIDGKHVGAITSLSLARDLAMQTADICISQDSTLAAVHYSTGQLDLLELRSGTLRYRLTAGPPAGQSLRFSSNNRWVATLSISRRDGRVFTKLSVFDVHTGREVLASVAGDSDSVSSFAFSRSGSELVIAKRANSRGVQPIVVTYWDLASDRLLATGAPSSEFDMVRLLSDIGMDIGPFERLQLRRSIFQVPSRQYLGDVFTDEWALSEDARFVGRRTRSDVWVWESASRKLVAQIKTTADQIGFLPSSKAIVSLDRNGFSVWPLDPDDRKALMSDPPLSDLRSAEAEIGRNAVSHLINGSKWMEYSLKTRALEAGDELVAKLDADNAAVRLDAAERLESSGAVGEPYLRQALADAPSAQVRNTAIALLNRIRVAALSEDELQDLRMIEVLERVGTPEAARKLSELLNTAPNWRLRQNIDRSLSRLPCERE